MLLADPDVLEVVGRRVDGIVGAIADAHAREQMRRRIQGCRDQVVAEEMLRRTPRWRWLARAIWRRRHRLAAAQCVANGKAGLCAFLRGNPYA